MAAFSIMTICHQLQDVTISLITLGMGRETERERERKRERKKERERKRERERERERAREQLGLCVLFWCYHRLSGHFIIYMLGEF
jgi:LmbE family N-acetylglucosaminyl deacetylase